MHKANSLFVVEEYERASSFYKKVFQDDDYSEEERGTAKFCMGKCKFFLEEYESACEIFSSSFSETLTSKAGMYLKKIELIKEETKKAEQAQKDPMISIKQEKQEEEEEVQPIEPSERKLPPPIDSDMLSQKKYRDKWLEYAATANFTIYAKGLKKDQVEVYFEKTRLTVDILVDGKTYRRVCDLPHPIDPRKSKWELTAYKINVQLAKVVPVKWGIFEVTAVAKTPSNPIENRNKKFEKLLEQKEDSDEEENGDSGDIGSSIQGMMKKLYNEGDDNMKRMIAETWTNRSNPDYKSSSLSD